MQEQHLEAEGGAQGSSRSKDHLNSSHDGLEVLGAGASVPIRGCAAAAAVGSVTGLISCRLDGLLQPAHQTAQYLVCKFCERLSSKNSKVYCQDQ